MRQLSAAWAWSSPLSRLQASKHKRAGPRPSSIRPPLQQSQALLDRDVERERAGELDRPTVLLSRIATLSARVDELTAARAVADATAALEAATQAPLSSPEFNTEAARALLKGQ